MRFDTAQPMSILCAASAAGRSRPTVVRRLGIGPRSNPCRRAPAAGGGLAHASWRKQVQVPWPCICRESWHGYGTCSLRSVRLGLLRLNRPDRQISPTCSLSREPQFLGPAGPPLCLRFSIAWRVRRTGTAPCGSRQGRNGCGPGQHLRTSPRAPLAPSPLRATTTHGRLAP